VVFTRGADIETVRVADAAGRALALSDRSLLRKFYETWRSLRDRGRPIELRLVTNWAWGPERSGPRPPGGQPLPPEGQGSPSEGQLSPPGGQPGPPGG